MKRLFKSFFSAFLSILILLSTACSGNEAPSSASVLQAEAPLQGARLITDVDGMMGRATAYTEDGMYQLVSWGEHGANITFFDYHTRARIYLCNRPDCTHTDESCPSWFSPEANAGGAGLFTDGKYLYHMRLGSGVEAGKPETATGTSSTIITRMELNGDNRETIMALGGAEFIWGAVAEKNGVFYFLQDSLVETNGTIAPLRQMVAYDTNTRQIKPIHEFDQNTYFIDICKDGFVMKTLELQPDNTTLQTVSLYRLATGEIEEVMQWGGMNIIAQAENGYLYYIDTYTAEFGAVDLDTKATTILSDSLPLHENDNIMRLGIYDGYLMFTVYEYEKRTVEGISYYSVHLETGELVENTLKYTAFNITNPVLIRAESNSHFLVIYNESLLTIPSTGPDGLPCDIESAEEHIALITKTDFWNNNPVYLPIENSDNFMYR